MGEGLRGIGLGEKRERECTISEGMVVRCSEMDRCESMILEGFDRTDWP